MLSTQGVAKALNVSPQTVRNYANDGVIPSQETLGGHRRFDLVDVQRALRRAKDRSFARLQADESPRLAAPSAEPIRLRGRRRRRISRASLIDASTPKTQNLEIPLIGKPGTSRFIVGDGARTR